MRLANKNFETFNDGILSVYEGEGRVITRVIQEKVSFGNRTIGIKRFYQAGVEGAKIDRLISVPINNFIQKDNIIIIDNTQYTIYQIQIKYDEKPPCLYLSLLKANIIYTNRCAKNG